AKIDLNGNQIILAGGMVLSNSFLSVENGTIKMMGDLNPENNLSFSGNQLQGISFDFEGEGQWKVRGSATIQKIEISNGVLDLENQEMTIAELVIKDDFQGSINMKGAKIKELEYLQVTSDKIITSAVTSFEMGSNGMIDANGFSMLGKIITLQESNVEIHGNAVFANLALSGTVTLTGNSSISNLELTAGTTLILASGSTQRLTENIAIAATANQRVMIKSEGTSKSSLNFVKYKKLCFDYIDIQNVDVLGLAVVNAGINSLLTNAVGWSNSRCEEVLFPNFSAESLCAGSLVSFENLSQGNIDRFEWNFNSALTPFTINDDAGGRHVFSDPGAYSVTLTVSNSNQTRSHTQIVDVLSNSLDNNSIIHSNGRLSSVKAAEEYRWFKDGVEIPGEVGRSYTYSGSPGVYFVLTVAEVCNRISSPYVVLSVLNNEKEIDTFDVFPNPVDDKLTIRINGLANDKTIIRLTD
ncbi:MAG: PKD domain-containing protein, partial [Cyclobacteriaceae bacterium]|nr:PKD domain-containing protein [Cyclobacteriaceae bacterium]